MIIVTGASRGPGAAIRTHRRETGREVIGIARDVTALPEPTFACDVSSYDALRSVAQDIKAQGMVVDGLINAAGIAAMNLARHRAHGPCRPRNALCRRKPHRIHHRISRSFTAGNKKKSN